MKAFVVLSVFCALAYANDANEFCFQDVTKACGSTNSKYGVKINCTAKYGAIEKVEPRLQQFINHYFIRSFDYLLLSTHFHNYQKNRDGFHKLFRGLSDNKWHEAIELIKYLTTRGGEMNFFKLPAVIENENKASPAFDLDELPAVSKALDLEKIIATEAHEIHNEATRKNVNFHDPEISDYIEREITHKERDVIRKLAGYVTDLSGLLESKDSSVALYLFDEYLQKQ